MVGRGTKTLHRHPETHCTFWLYKASYSSSVPHIPNFSWNWGGGGAGGHGMPLWLRHWRKFVFKANSDDARPRTPRVQGQSCGCVWCVIVIVMVSLAWYWSLILFQVHAVVAWVPFDWPLEMKIRPRLVLVVSVQIIIQYVSMLPGPPCPRCVCNVTLVSAVPRQWQRRLKIC